MRAPVQKLVIVSGIAGIMWLARHCIADLLTQRYAQRPTGSGARVLYGARRAGYDGLDAMLTALALSEGDRLIEIGPGGGFLVEAALTRRASVTAVDHSPEMLRVTAERNQAAVDAGQLRLVEADAGALPLASGAFDVAVTNDVLLVVRDASAMFAELARVLRPCAQLVVQTRSPRVQVPMRVLGLGWMARRLRFYEDDELADMLHRVGFDHVRIRHDPRTLTQQVVAIPGRPDSDH